MDPLDPDPVEKDQSVDSVMRRGPATIRVFIEHRMLCVGCPIGTLHTVEEACAAHRLDLTPLLQALRQAAHRSPTQAQAEADLPSATSSSL